MTSGRREERSHAFPPIARFILFGGTPHLLDAARYLKELKADVLVITEPFHLGEVVNELGSLRLNLERSDISYQTHETINKDALGRHVNDHTVGISVHPVWIFRRDVIDLFDGRLFNFHGAMLPRDRGGGAQSWRILMGRRDGGVVIHRLEEGIDTGDIVMSEAFDFPVHCRIPIDFLRFDAEKRCQLIRKFIDTLRAGEVLHYTSQDEAASTYWSRLNTKLNGFLDWRWPVDAIERFICAFDAPYEGASTFLREHRVHLKECMVGAGEGSFHPFQSGLVFRISESALYVAAPGGHLVIRHVSDPEGNSLFSRVRLGDRFHTPEMHLEEARSTRAVYTAAGLRSR